MLAWRPSLALVLLASAAVLASSTVSAAGSNSGAVTYRWVDENGVVHYGDRVPPQYATKESVLLNKQGVEVGHTEAQKSPEQLAEDERQRQEMLRQKQHDAFLLTTYTSVKDIEALRDERLLQIGGQRHAAEQYIEGLHSRLNALQTRARTFKPYSDNPGAHRMPDDLAEDLVRTMNEMRTQRNALVVKDAEENALRQQFQVDIERYRELRKPAIR
jgi:Domain of unknown function (DUF4124)